mmetsp:Transcript_2613/g.7095  ORF Transcript_2613/g.7095 Transcript_2613/m.7095 type:complete len:272 (-) Transcript_2613:830-1645(-)
MVARLRCVLGECHERAHAVAGRAFFPDGAGDVEMRPRRGRLDKVAQKQRRGDRPAAAPAHVADVRHFALDLLGILRGHRHVPHLLAARLCRRKHLVRRGLVRWKQTCVIVSERDDDRPGERRHIKNKLDAILAGRLFGRLLRKHERVREREPALRVSVTDFDGDSVRRGQNVARAIRVSVDHVFARGHHKVYLHAFWFQRADRLRSAQHSGSTAHVKFHQLNHRASAGLDVVAAAVESEALPYKRKRARWRDIFGCVRRRVHNVDQLWRIL